MSSAINAPAQCAPTQLSALQPVAKVGQVCSKHCWSIGRSAPHTVATRQMASVGAKVHDAVMHSTLQDRQAVTGGPQGLKGETVAQHLLTVWYTCCICCCTVRLCLLLAGMIHRLPLCSTQHAATAHMHLDEQSAPYCMPNVLLKSLKHLLVVLPGNKGQQTAPGDSCVLWGSSPVGLSQILLHSRCQAMPQ